MTIMQLPKILPKNQTASKMWDAGALQYDRISRQISDAIEHCVDRLAPQSNESVLDVATGTGWAARRVAQHASHVTAIDFSEEAVGVARQLCGEDNVEFQQGDAEAMSFADDSFDAVISTFGVMFCSDPISAARELRRVCRSQGRILLALWEDHGGVMDLFRIIGKYKPRPETPPPSPFAWASRDRLQELFGADAEVKIERGISYHRESKAEDAWTAFREGYGPVRTLLTKLTEAEAQAFEYDFVSYHQRRATDLGICVERPYVIAQVTF